MRRRIAVLLAVVFLLGVTWESAALATMVPVALMIVSPILAQEKTMVKLLSSEWSRELWKALYAVLPKVFDIGRITMNIVRERARGADKKKEAALDERKKPEQDLVVAAAQSGAEHFGRAYDRARERALRGGCENDAIGFGFAASVNVHRTQG